jgi:predicted DNA-binding protein (UPF0251 family)/DNA-directed RNA polymerase subunit RPC12/RpoP
MKPRKIRDVSLPPKVVFFKPKGIPLREIEIVNLTIDEYEAVRLADYEDFKHYEAAEKMNISRPTFTRLLESAHKKISTSIVEGKAIRIEGGDFKFSNKVFQCRRCGQLQNLQSKEDEKSNCSNCSSDELKEISPDSFRRFRGGR